MVYHRGNCVFTTLASVLRNVMKCSEQGLLRLLFLFGCDFFFLGAQKKEVVAFPASGSQKKRSRGLAGPGIPKKKEVVALPGPGSQKKRSRGFSGPGIPKKKKSPLWARKPAREPEKEVVTGEKRSRRRAAWRTRNGGQTIEKPSEFSHLSTFLGLP